MLVVLDCVVVLFWFGVLFAQGDDVRCDVGCCVLFVRGDLLAEVFGE